MQTQVPIKYRDEMIPYCTTVIIQASASDKKSIPRSEICELAEKCKGKQIIVVLRDYKGSIHDYNEFRDKEQIRRATGITTSGSIYAFPSLDKIKESDKLKVDEFFKVCIKEITDELYNHFYKVCNFKCKFKNEFTDEIQLFIKSNPKFSIKNAIPLYSIVRQYCKIINEITEAMNQDTIDSKMKEKEMVGKELKEAAKHLDECPISLSFYKLVNKTNNYQFLLSYCNLIKGISNRNNKPLKEQIIRVKDEYNLAISTKKSREEIMSLQNKYQQLYSEIELNSILWREYSFFIRNNPKVTV